MQISRLAFGSLEMTLLCVLYKAVSSGIFLQGIVGIEKVVF
jgi:hypothetical protein